MKHILAFLALALPSAALAEGTSTYRTTPAVGTSLVVPGGYFSGANVTSGATAGYVLVIDARTVPAAGAVTPVVCMPLAANTGIDLNYRGGPIRMTSGGSVIVFSTTGCFSYTVSATAFITGYVQ